MRLRIEIKIVGARAAGETTVKVLVPQRYGGGSALRWCDAGGVVIPEVPAGTATEEQIGDGDAARPAVLLYRKLESVSVRTPEVLYVRLHVDPVPTPGEIGLPVRVKAQADALADDMEEEVVEKTLLVRSGPL